MSDLPYDFIETEEQDEETESDHETELGITVNGETNDGGDFLRKAINQVKKVFQ